MVAIVSVSNAVRAMICGCFMLVLFASSSHAAVLGMGTRPRIVSVVDKQGNVVVTERRMNGGISQLEWLLHRCDVKLLTPAGENVLETRKLPPGSEDLPLVLTVEERGPSSEAIDLVDGLAMEKMQMGRKGISEVEIDETKSLSMQEIVKALETKGWKYKQAYYDGPSCQTDDARNPERVTRLHVKKTADTVVSKDRRAQEMLINFIIDGPNSVTTFSREFVREFEGKTMEPGFLVTQDVPPETFLAGPVLEFLPLCPLKGLEKRQIKTFRCLSGSSVDSASVVGRHRLLNHFDASGHPLVKFTTSRAAVDFVNGLVIELDAMFLHSSKHFDLKEKSLTMGEIVVALEKKGWKYPEAYHDGAQSGFDPATTKLTGLGIKKTADTGVLPEGRRRSQTIVIDFVVISDSSSSYSRSAFPREFVNV